MRKTIAYLIILLLQSVPASGFGAEIKGLYEAEIRVFSQKSQERASAMQQALVEVLIKVSGRSNVTGIDAIKEAISKPTRYLQLYRYRKLTPAETQALRREQELDPAVPRRGEPQMVFFSFDKSVVDKLLRSNDMPVWGSTRPAMLVWLAVQDQNRRYLAGADLVDPVSQALSAEAQQRGMALLLPLLDLEDQVALRFEDVWAGFPQPVKDASQRYATEAILLGRLYRGFGDQWQSQWALLEGKEESAWEVAAEQPEQAISEAIARATEVLSARYAPVSSGQLAGLLPVEVNDIRNLADFARVSQYLQSLQQVSKLYVSKLDQNRVRFELSIRGNPDNIARTIALGNVLAPGKVMDDDTVNQSQLVVPTQAYYLLP